MRSSFSEINNFWDTADRINNLIILNADSPEERSSFFLDLIIHSAQAQKTYVCCASRYLLEDKFNSLDINKRHNIVFIENIKDLPLHRGGSFFFYEPSNYWAGAIQKILAYNRKVVINASSKEKISMSGFYSYQQIQISETRKSFDFKITNSWEQGEKVVSSAKPLSYHRFSYFLETNSLKYLLEEFFETRFYHRSFIVKNYFPQIVGLFGVNCSLRNFLKEKMGIKSFKFWEVLKSKMIKTDDLGVVEVNFAPLNLCWSLYQTHPGVTIDYMYQVIQAPLDKIQLRRPQFNFFRVVKLPRLIKMLTHPSVEDSCCLEALELEYEILNKKQSDLADIIPRRINKLSDLKNFLSSLSYKYHENKTTPENIFHVINHENIFAPRDYFELCQIKIQFKNCVSLYFEDIMARKIIILKITKGNKKFCVSVDAKNYKIKSMKLPENKELTLEDALYVENLLDEVLQRKNLKKRFKNIFLSMLT